MAVDRKRTPAWAGRDADIMDEALEAGARRAAAPDPVDVTVTPEPATANMHIPEPTIIVDPPEVSG